MKERSAKTIFGLLWPLALAAAGAFVGYYLFTTGGIVEGYVRAIDESRDTVLKLIASSTASSAAITMLPGDWGSPIAGTMADLTKGFLVVLCALYLEKFILAVAGKVAFLWLVPAAGGLFFVGNLFAQSREMTHALARRLLATALALVLVVPVSVSVSRMVETTYRDSINQVIASAEASADQIQQSVGSDRNEPEAAGGLAKVIQSLQSAGDSIANGTEQMVQYFQRLLSRFIESVAIMVVISCIIPLLVLLFFVGLLKSLYNVNAYENLSTLQKVFGKRKAGHHEQTLSEPPDELP